MEPESHKINDDVMGEDDGMLHVIEPSALVVAGHQWTIVLAPAMLLAVGIVVSGMLLLQVGLIW